MLKIRFLVYVILFLAKGNFSELTQKKSTQKEVVASQLKSTRKECG